MVCLIKILKKIQMQKNLYEISYKEVVSSKLKVMDLTAITLCEENKMPIRVFDGTTTKYIQSFNW